MRAVCLLVVLAAGLSDILAGDPDWFLAVNWHFQDSLAFHVNAVTGERVELGPTGFAELNSLARNSAGEVYSMGFDGQDNVLITIDPDTGAGTVVVRIQFSYPPQNLTALAISPENELFLSSGDLLWRLDPCTGDATSVGNLPGAAHVNGLAFSPSGTLYGWNNPSGLNIIDPDTGDTQLIGGPAIGDIQTIAFSPSGELFGVGTDIYQIDILTGQTTLIHDGAPPQIRGADFLVWAPESCGDGILDPGEQCDDGNNFNGDGCQGNCRLPICGDWIVDLPDEECDDGNNVDGDCCSADCLLGQAVPAFTGSGAFVLVALFVAASGASVYFRRR